MEKPGTKEAAESVLRELPSVVGAFVREDAYGNPREIHLLIKAGPKVAGFARDVKDLLEERLGVPIDQRVISIAQLAGETVGMGGVQVAPPAQEPAAEESALGVAPGVAPAYEAEEPAPQDAAVRLRFLGAAHEEIEGRVIVRVRLEWEGREYVGEAVELAAGSGRVRAGATAALRAATAACAGRARIELEAASLVKAMNREYALVSALASAAALGRQPLLLSGAKPLDELEPVETAAALAALKAANRVIGLIVRLGGEHPAGVRRRSDRRPR
jgi:hypothetical protein